MTRYLKRRKRCSRCGLKKSLDEFHRHSPRAKDFQDGRQWYCRHCLLTYNREKRAERMRNATYREILSAFKREARKAARMNATSTEA